jgi:YfiH family protein
VTAGACDQLITRGPDLGDGVLTAFSGRAGGVSPPPYQELNLGLGVSDEPAAVQANRAALALACGLPPASLTFMRQVHGADVWYAGTGSAEPPEPVDAMFTDEPGRALCVLVADCVPVLVADPVARLVGAAHAGREGLVAGVVPALVAAMTAAGARPARMRAVTGPAICGGCYEVPPEMRGSVSATVPAARCDTFAGTAGLDIGAGVRAQLAGAGVGSVTADGRCTRESDGLYSYRRDGLTGRFAGLVWLAPG